MVKCRDCGEDMVFSNGCSKPLTITMFDTSELERVPYDDDFPCHDCNATNGHLHHLGCDMERCPQCKGQLISCSCWYDGITKSMVDSYTDKYLKYNEETEEWLDTRTKETWGDLEGNEEWFVEEVIKLMKEGEDI